MERQISMKFGDGRAEFQSDQSMERIESVAPLGRLTVCIARAEGLEISGRATVGMQLFCEVMFDKVHASTKYSIPSELVWDEEISFDSSLPTADQGGSRKSVTLYTPQLALPGIIFSQ